MKQIQYAFVLTLTVAVGYFATGCASHGRHHGHAHGKAEKCCGTCGGKEEAKCCSKDGDKCCHGGKKDGHKH